MNSRDARPSARWLLGIAVTGGLLAACSPALDWRETPVPESALSALFPCKPDAHVRRVALAGATREMHLASCAADDTVFAVSHVDVGDPARVTEVMQALRALAAENIGGTAKVVSALRIPGMTPNPLAERLAMTGKRMDGLVIEAQAVFFTRAAVVYQATVVGTRVDAEAVDTFFTALKLP
ncbi:MAG: hypothetical protein K2Y02_03045 [Burkholderiaceae bacterium]|nr:hypothetical protein [Burkholderiaceae bacterium]